MTPGRRAWIEAVTIAVVCVLVYAGALHNGYHLDDQYRIVENSQLEQVWPPWRHLFDPATSSSLPTIVQFRPLLPLSLSLTTWLSDAAGIERVVGHHLGNLALHALAAILVARLARKLAERGAPEVPARWLGLASGLLYAVHPVGGVPVNYLCARDLLLMQVFLLGSLLWFLRLRVEGSTPGRWAAALTLLALSLLSKTDAVVAPALVGAIDVAIFGAALRERGTWLRAGAFAIPVLGFFAWTELGLDFSDAGQLVIDRPLLEYPLTQAELHWTYYLRNFAWPFHMRVLPAVEPASGPGDLGALFGLLSILGSIGIAWRIRRRMPLLALCIVAYWIAFAPTSWFLPFRYLATDYRQVPSLPWLCTAVAWAVLRGLPRREAAAILGVLVAYFAAASLLINRVWKDERTLWGHSIRHGAEVQAHVNYARAVAGDDPSLAEAHYHEALRRAPGNVFALINLGMLEVSQRRFDAGIARLEHAAALAPDWPLTADWLDRGCRSALALASMGARTKSPALVRCRRRLGG